MLLRITLGHPSGLLHGQVAVCTPQRQLRFPFFSAPDRLLLIVGPHSVSKRSLCRVPGQHTPRQACEEGSYGPQLPVFEHADRE